MDHVPEPNLLLDEDGPHGPAWYCPLHGTVRKCPFVWMACDAPSRAEDARSPSLGCFGWKDSAGTLLFSTELKAPNERDSTECNANEVSGPSSRA